MGEFKAKKDKKIKKHTKPPRVLGSPTNKTTTANGASIDATDTKSPQTDHATELLGMLERPNNVTPKSPSSNNSNRKKMVSPPAATLVSFQDHSDALAESTKKWEKKQKLKKKSQTRPPRVATVSSKKNNQNSKQNKIPNTTTNNNRRKSVTYTTKNVKKKRKSYLKKKIKEEEELSISRRKDSKNVQTFLERVFACYDVDGDGHIDRDELKKWYVAVENWIQKTKYQKEDQKLRSTFLNVNVDVDDIEHSISFEKGPIGLKLIHQNDGNHVHHIETDSQADSHSDILQNGYRLIRINEMDVPRGMSMEHAMDILR